MQIYVFKNAPYDTSLKAKEVALRDFVKTHFCADIKKVTERIIPINHHNAKIILKIYWQVGGSKHISTRTITCREVWGSGYANFSELLNVAKVIEEEEQRNRNHASQFHSDDLTNWRGR
jgi:hypothetical protein